MRPTLRQLEYLVAVAETGKFGEAAKHMNVSQPSLSSQIADMEDYLGGRLVERGRRGAIMTPIGEACVMRARDILRQVEEMKAAVRHSAGELFGRVKLGVLPTIGPYLLPIAAKRLHGSYPELRLLVSEARTVDLDEAMLSGRLDTIISTPDDHPDMESIALFHEDFWICSADEHPLSQSTGPITIDALKGQALLTLGPGHRLTSIAEDIAHIAGARISSDYTGTSLDATRQTAVMGGGVAILPRLYALSEARRDPDLVVRRIDHVIAHRDIHLCWRAGSPIADNFRMLGESLAAIAAELLGEPPD